MAQGATIYNFDVQLSDVDRGVYEALSFTAARAPSETAEYLVIRVLAYCLEYADGVAFGKGLAEPDEPALTLRDLTGTVKVWVEVGAPDAARLHRASKGAPRVVIYTHRDPATLLRNWSGERIHRAEAVELYTFDGDVVPGLAERLERRTAFEVSITDRHLFVTLGAESFEAELTRHPLTG